MKDRMKPVLKKVWKPILLTVLIFVTLSCTVTKVVYDHIFRRYDPPAAETEAFLQAQEGQTHRFFFEEIPLQGYFYPTEEREILILIVPGFHAGAENYAPQTEHFIQQGWGVFSFDPTGSYASGGDSYVGFPQALWDLEAALDYLDSQGRFGYEKLVIFGHSRGGYAACCALESGYSVDAVISVGGINSAMEGVMEPFASSIGPLAYVNYPFLWAYQALLFGSGTVNLDAAQILSHSEVPALIIHGTGDTRVSPHAYSIYSYEEEILSEEVEFFAMDRPGQDGHVDLLVDADGSANDILMEQIEDFIRRNSD